MNQIAIVGGVYRYIHLTSKKIEIEIEIEIEIGIEIEIDEAYAEMF